MGNAQADNAADLLDGLIARARRLGADAADAVMLQRQRSGCELPAWRAGGGRPLGGAQPGPARLRRAKRQAIVSTTDLSQAALEPLAERAIAMARAVPEDPYAGLADPARLARDWPPLDLVDTAEPDAESLMARAAEAEDAARAVAGVTNSEGASAGWRRREADPGHQRRLRRRLANPAATRSAPRRSPAKARRWSATTSGRARCTRPIWTTPRR